MKWLTNCFKSDINETIDELKYGNKGRTLVIGDPKPTKWLSVKDMKRSDENNEEIVGIYEA